MKFSECVILPGEGFSLKLAEVLFDDGAALAGIGISKTPRHPRSFLERGRRRSIIGGVKDRGMFIETFGEAVKLAQRAEMR